MITGTDTVSPWAASALDAVTVRPSGASAANAIVLEDSNITQAIKIAKYFFMSLLYINLFRESNMLPAVSIYDMIPGSKGHALTAYQEKFLAREKFMNL
jgi:hypothetical protein